MCLEEVINYLNVLINESIDGIKIDIERTVKLMKECWTLPLLGMLKINVDATFMKEAAVVAMMVRDSIKEVIHLESFLVSAISSKVVELLALNWAILIAFSKE